jgi:CheY-like chemotaxis protein
MDLNYARDTTSGQEGLDLLDRIQSIDPTLPVIVMTAWGSVELAVEAMRRGARDFVQKPWENARLARSCATRSSCRARVRAGLRLEAENRVLRADGEPRGELIAASPAMAPILEIIDRVGPSDANVLITGPNGSGKNVVAAALHARSARAARPMVTVNAGGLSEGVFRERALRPRARRLHRRPRRSRRTLRARRRAARSSWTRSRMCPSRSRRGCSGSWRRARWSASGPRAPAAST